MTTYKDFYPTPVNLIHKMLSGIDWLFINSILEPSAGKGDLADGVVNTLTARTRRYDDKRKPDIECVEINTDLQNVLKGKGYRVVHDDFLTYVTFRRYDLIVMNPPFSMGDRHLLKALEMQKNGGTIVCLLNAETLRNPFTITRKDLLRKLEEHDAQIEYLQNSFSNAERQSDVEIAIVKVNIPYTAGHSVILDHLEKAKDNYIRAAEQAQYSVAPRDIIEAVVAQYQYEAKAGCQLIQDFRALSPITSKEFDKCDNILSLSMNRYNGETANETLYIRELRYKYWKTLFESDKFSGVFTSNLRSKYMEKLDELRDYEFSFHNIYQIRIDMSNQMVQGIEDAIVALFDELSHKHSWYDETSRNIHYYNGWKTNKAWIINKKVIIPLAAFDSWDGKFRPYHRNVDQKLIDIEKVFDFLSGNISSESAIPSILNALKETGQTANVEFKYFKATFYKKGTCHITFTDLELLKKFNIYGSQSKNWLPPVYGKANYKDMSQEEQAVIDSFEGKESYEKTVLKSEFFLQRTPPQMLSLGVGA